MTLPHSAQNIEIEVTEALREWLPAGRKLAKQSNLVRDLGFDSARLVDVVIDIEGRLGITIPVDRIVDIETVEDLVRTVGELVESLGQIPNR